ncbi:phosphatidylinositol phosphate synthase [Arthrobacter mangrovi]|uniref:Phosphatidylinositol phosphate synthase n=1 Tax=Arthrobacter mangrovi TaxID=2966350 RepID=A0ABQ5MUJ1_9MICC|nr:CDP-alcohol phosphatidyltransferase family protein [Arthrobacter mangrovi]GLB67450.1 CDP-alcohol phosphatidyltransferase [Arthrobacter mangrovi]
MLNKYARGFFGRLFSPVAKLLLRWGISPDVVTVVGTIGVCLGALVFYPMGELFWGTVVITVFVFADMVDGLMARMQDRSSRWGSFLDSTLDRLADASVFSGVAIWFFTGGANTGIALASLACLVLGMLVSYARSKAESLGCTADVGIAERSERLVAVLVFTGFTGLGLPPVVLLAVLLLLAAASFITVLQRVGTVYRQLHAVS